MRTYSDPKREDDPHALPDIEVFEMTKDDPMWFELDTLWADMLKDEILYDGQIPGNVWDTWYPREIVAERLAGWYWWSRFPGCLPDSDPIGPFDTEESATADAQEPFLDDECPEEDPGHMDKLDA